MCDGCGYYVDNFIYGYQVYCTHPTEYWINPFGWLLLIILIIIFLLHLLFSSMVKYKMETEINKII